MWSATGRRCEEPSRRSRQWGNESSGNVACLVITSLTDRLRGLKTSSFVRSKAFSRPSLVIGEFPGAQLLHDRSRDFGLATSVSVTIALWRSPREDTACHYLNESHRRGSFRRRHDIIFDRREPAARPVQSRPHTYSPFLPWNQSQNVLIPVRFQRSSLARSRNPAIAIDEFLRNFAVDTASDDTHSVEFILRRVRFAQETSSIDISDVWQTTEPKWFCRATWIGAYSWIASSSATHNCADERKIINYNSSMRL